MAADMTDTINAGLELQPPLEDEARGLLAEGSQLVRLKAGQAVFAPGISCRNYLVVRAGSVRVSTMTENGREVVLYRVGPGEACVLTTACLLTARDYDAYGSAETDVEAQAIPKPLFEALLASSTAFRGFVFGQFGERLREVIALVQEVAERQVDRRLARFLIDKGADGPVLMTHQAIAMELGTAREVVSRLLKDFSLQGLVTLERGRIVVADRNALAKLQGAV
jgi:CRP/FNR family transcriptional regulator, anaerobic regulatory protein